MLKALTEAYRRAAAAPSTFDWTSARTALGALPSGAWTTYGDVAELAGTHPIVVGRWLSTEPDVPNAYRVLGADGKVRPDFRWLNPADERDVLEVLREDGVRVGADGVADPAQRLGAAELGQLAGELR